MTSHLPEPVKVRPIFFGIQAMFPKLLSCSSDVRIDLTMGKDMASTLNDDILRLVFDEFNETPSDFLPLALVSKSFLELVTPII